MSVKLVAPPLKWHTITLAPETTVRIGLRNPTWSQSTSDLGVTLYGSEEKKAERMLQRLQAVVADWADVLGEDDKPVPYSWSGLQSLAEAYPGLILELVSLTRDVFNQEASSVPN